MSVKIKLTRQALVIITSTLQPLYNSKANTRQERSVLAIGLQVAAKLDRKFIGVKPANLFDDKKPITVSLLIYEADILERILLQEVVKVEDDFIKLQIQKVINGINQKLA